MTDRETAKGETQSTIAQWATETFGKAPDQTALIDRALIELHELKEAITAGDKDEIGAETADILILLYRILEDNGLNAAKEVDAKMKINRTRQWLPKGDGTGSHIK